MPGLDDYGALLRSGQAAVPDYAADEARKQLLALHRAQEQRLTAQAQREAADELGFQNDLTTVLAHPSAQGYSALALKHPKFAQQIKSSFEMQDKAKQDSDFQAMSEVYSAVLAGKHDLAASMMQRRIEADKQAGQDTTHDQMLYDALSSDDPVQQKAALGMVGFTLSSIKPDKFNETYGSLNKDKSYTLAPGDVRFDADNKQVASVAAKPDFLVVPEGGKAIPLNPAATAVGTGGGDPASSPGVAVPPNATPAVKAVASTLASSGLPAPVVAGFMGNFHAEGGYEGAQGDGGSASGIAQWHSDRAATFQQVIGKPVTEATPAEQAKFVVWEMQNPEAAGMTVDQRDAILNAKTPAQAAALIDQHYERSSGQDRHVRMAAANAFAGGFTPAAQPGDVPGTVYGNPKPKARTLTAAEARAHGLDTAKVYEQRPDGTISAVGDATAGGVGGPLKPDALRAAAVGYIKTGKMPAGMGGQAVKNQILNYVPQIMDEHGLTPDDIPSIQQQFGADAAAFKNRVGQLSYMRQSVGKLNQHAQDLSKLIKAIPLQGNFTPFNWITQGAEGMVSNSTLAQLRGGLPLFEGEVARVMTGNPNSGAGQLSDDARHEFDILHSSQAPSAKIDAMNRIMKMVEESVKATRDETGTLKSRIGGGIDVYAGNGPAAKAPQTEGWITLPSGLKIRKVN
jgi:hypothetical protein